MRADAGTETSVIERASAAPLRALRLAEAQELVMRTARPLGTELLPLAKAAGRFAAAPVFAVRPFPPFACSAMDGYAVRASEAIPGTELAVRGVLYAGDAAGVPLGLGEVARIFTGAPLPEGADAVIRQEEARLSPTGAVKFTRPATPGQNVRQAGEDLLAGALAVPMGTRLGPRHIALCAATGVETVRVAIRPRVAIVSTGDEVLTGRVPDSNGLALELSLRALGAAPVRMRVGDNLPRLTAALAEAAEQADVIVTVGGVSVGDRDHVPAAVAALGARPLVHGVRIKPGKPFLFTTLRGRPLFGLPGSPSACLVTYEAFTRPALLSMMGASSPWRRSARLRLTAALPGTPGRARFHWGALTDDGLVLPLGRDVAQVRGPALASALIQVSEETGDLPAGATVHAWLLEEAAP